MPAKVVCSDNNAGQSAHGGRTGETGKALLPHFLVSDCRCCCKQRECEEVEMPNEALKLSANPLALPATEQR